MSGGVFPFSISSLRGGTRMEVGMARTFQGNVRSRIVLLFLGIVILCAALPGCGLNRTGPDEAEKAAMRELQGAAVGAAMLLDLYMDARVTDMLVGSSTCRSLREALTSTEARPDANRALEDWLKISGAYEAILLLDKAGICLASAPAGLVNHDFSDDSAFKGAVKGKLTVSDAHKSDLLISLDPKSNGWTAAIAVPVRTEKGFEGVLLSYLKWSRLENLIMGLKVGQTGYAFVLDRDNRVIVHPDPHFYGVGLRDSRINLPELDDGVKRKAVHMSYSYKHPITGRETRLVGLAYSSGHRNFPGLGWTVGAGANESDIVVEPLWMRLFR